MCDFQSLEGKEGMRFAFVPMTMPRAITVGTVLGYLIAGTSSSLSSESRGPA